MTLKEQSKYGWVKDEGWSDQWLRAKQLRGVSCNSVVVTFSDKGMSLAKDLSVRNKVSVQTLVAKAVRKRMLKLRNNLGSALR